MYVVDGNTDPGIPKMRRDPVQLGDVLAQLREDLVGKDVARPEGAVIDD